MIRIFDNVIIDAEDGSGVGCEGLPLITCGLSQKSSVTASSIGDDGFVYCIQRGFFTCDGDSVLPQEFKVRWTAKRENIYPCLELVTTLLLAGIDPALIAEKLIIF